MLRKKIVWLVAAAIAAIALVTAYYTTDLFRDPKKFAVRESAAISRITIEKDTLSIVLEKQASGEWTVNGKSNVNPMMIRRLIYFLENVEPVAPLPREAKKLGKIAMANGFYITVESSSKILSEFTIGEIKNSNIGSLGQVEGASSIYLLQIPGSTFSLASVLSVDINDWTQNAVVALQPQDIVSIKVDNIAKPANSFKISIGTDGNFHIYDTYNEREVKGYNEDQLKFYLSFYESLGYNSIVKMSDIDRSTLILSQPEAIITVADLKGHTYKLGLYLLPIGDDYNEVGRPLKYDRDKFYLVFNNDKEVAIASWVEYDLLLKDVSFFLITS